MTATTTESAEQLKDRLNLSLHQWEHRACVGMDLSSGGLSPEYVDIGPVRETFAASGKTEDDRREAFAPRTRQVAAWLKTEGFTAKRDTWQTGIHFVIRKWEPPKVSAPMAKLNLETALEPISMDESRDLIRLECVVEKGLNTFVEVGEALAEIRDRKLYRTEHPTFAEYCKAKWKMSDRRARQLMDAAEVTSTIAKSGTTVPKSERQARPLAALPPAQQAEAWEKAVASSPDGQPTAKDVQGVVETMNPKPPKTANVVVPRQTASEPDAKKTPLQWLTHYWMEATEDDRRMFDNFRAGLRGGRT